MPRQNRIHVPGGIYHVMLRGNARERIFFQDEDRLRLNDLVADGLERYECRLHAFCWMTNHIHAAIQVSSEPLSGLMCWLASRYARYLNRRRERTGHVFERRHRALLVTDDEYLLGLVRYIHLNPVDAGLVEDPADYPWSSHRNYCGLQKLPWLTTRAVLSCFAESVLVARRQYQKFMSADHDWTPTVGEPTKDSADSPLMTTEPLMQEQLDVTTGDVFSTLDTLVEEFCETYDLNQTVLCRPGRQRQAARIRALISHHAISKGLATLTQLATYFGRAPEVISRGIERYCGDALDPRSK